MKHKNFFIVPNQIFKLGLKPKEFVVYPYEKLQKRRAVFVFSKDPYFFALGSFLLFAPERDQSEDGMKNAHREAPCRNIELPMVNNAGKQKCEEENCLYTQGFSIAFAIVRPSRPFRRKI